MPCSFLGHNYSVRAGCFDGKAAETVAKQRC